MTTTTIMAVILLSLLSVFTTAAGVALALLFRESEKGVAAGIGFSAGIMLSISFLDLVPATLAEIGTVPTLVAVGLGSVILAVFNIIIPHTHLLEEQGVQSLPLLKSAYLVALGLILHDFPEGFAMANAYIAAPSLGVMVALAIAVHNLPEEFAIALPAVALKKKKFLFGAAFLSALAEPAGAILGLMAVHLRPELNYYFMAFAAGAMIFVSLHELFPMARKFGNTTWFGVGFVLSILVYFSLRLLIPEP